jgi:hypothetical protein
MTKEFVVQDINRTDENVEKMQNLVRSDSQPSLLYGHIEAVT